MTKFTNILNTRILLSGATILAALALVVGGTFAFFSDTETSNDNTFVAGDIDLQIDNTSYALDFNIPNYPSPTGVLVANPANTWAMKDLTTLEKFFNFTDLKPGDYGEDTISVHVGSNDAWVCAAARLTTDQDNSCTEPELADDPTCVAPATNGELDSEVEFAFWSDDGDNVFEQDETIFLQGPLSGLGTAGQIALADSTGSIVPGDGPIPGDSTFFIGKIWCFGDLTPAPVVQSANSPLTNTGFTCSGTLVNNAAQTDSVVGDLQFFAVQARNNAAFTCSSWTPVWTTPPTPSPTGLPN